MPDHPSPTPRPERLVTAVGTVIGLCILGDSFLYSILPLEADRLGIALPLVGVLLSVNRLVRLGSNTWAGMIFERFTPRRPFVLATMLALITTSTYGVAQGFLMFLLARLGWGVAWSGLRQGGYQAVWVGGENVRGRLMGLLWGIIRLGSAASVVVGGLLRDRFGYYSAIFAVMCATALALPVALSIRWPATSSRPALVRESSLGSWQTILTSDRKRRLLAAGFIHGAFEGILISTTSLFLAGRLGTNDLLLGWGIRVGTVAGFLLAVRWTSDMLFGPAVGVLSDRLGQLHTLVLLACVLLLAIVGVAGLANAPLLLCLLLVFVSSAGLNITLSAVANGVAFHSERPHLFVGVYTTATDAGAATGPLVAYSAGNLIGMNLLYVGASVVLTLAVLQYCRMGKGTSKPGGAYERA